MSFQFVISCAMCLAVLFVPGYFALRAARLPRLWALTSAPAVSLAMVVLVGEFFALVGIPAIPATVLGLPLLAGMASFFACRRIVEARAVRLTGWCLLIAVGCGLFVGWFYLMCTMPDTASVYQTENVVDQLVGVRSLIDARRLSGFSSFAYDSAADRAIAPLSGGAFRPVGWYALVAVVAQLAGSEVPVAVNAVNYMVAGVVWPLSMQCLLAGVLEDDRLSQALAAFATSAFVLFPWALLGTNPLYQDLLALALSPAAAGLFLEVIRPGRPRRERLRLAINFGACALGVATVQPLVAFILGMFLLPLCVSELWVLGASRRRSWRELPAPTHRREPWEREEADAEVSPVSGRVAAVVLLAFLLGLWLLLVSVPQAGETAYAERASGDIIDAVANVVLVRYAGVAAPELVQPLLGAFVLAGIVRTLVERRSRWIAVSYLFATGVVTANTCLTGPLRVLLTGLWGGDPFRIAAIACVFAVPLMGLGISWASSGIARLIHQLMRSDEWGVDELAAGVSVFMAVLFGAVTYGGAGSLPFLGSASGAFDAYSRAALASYAADAPLSEDERAFLAEVADIIPPNAVVINNPYDGSALAYPCYRMRCYWRGTDGYGAEGESAQGRLIRERLVDFSEDLEVREAVRDLGAEYVIELDDGKPGAMLEGVAEEAREAFSGVTRVSETTPGFELVFSSGDLKLYHVTA